MSKRKKNTKSCVAQDTQGGMASLSDVVGRFPAELANLMLPLAYLLEVMVPMADLAFVNAVNFLTAMEMAAAFLTAVGRSHANGDDSQTAYNAAMAAVHEATASAVFIGEFEGYLVQARFEIPGGLKYRWNHVLLTIDDRFVYRYTPSRCTLEATCDLASLSDEESEWLDGGWLNREPPATMSEAVSLAERFRDHLETLETER